MTVVPDAPVTPAALSAFLRGVERRGLVLAQLQCGDVAAAERALAAALRAFSSQAAGRPMAGWPMRFWSLLATAPPLRREPMPGTWLPPFTVLGRMQTADRLALLLRIVAGLEEGVASEVQGVEAADYRQSLARACPRDAAGNPDAQAWRALAEAAQVELRDLSPAQLTRLSQLRDSALAGMPLAAAPSEPAPAPRRPAAARARRQWRWPQLERRHAGMALGVLAVALLLAVLGWWWAHRRPALPPEPVSQA
ncbi:membrane protein, partial [Xanthomonas perforans]